MLRGASTSLVARRFASTPSPATISAARRPPFFHTPLGANRRWMSTNPAADSNTPESAPAFRSKMKQDVNAVVIGGGALGASVLYHLAAAGITDAVLLEKTELTAGSTWHAAGLVTYFNPGNNLRNIHSYSLGLYPELEKETGQSMSFHGPGSIRMMEEGDRMDECYYQVGKAKLWPGEHHLITPQEIKRLHPLVNTEGIVAGLYSPRDGHIDPAGVTHALAMAAKSRGAEIYKPVEVTGLKELEKGNWEVETTAGTIRTKMVINCGGLWGDKVGAMAGVHTPVVPIRHQYVTIGPIQEVIDFQKEHGHQLPVLRDLAGSYYLRQERDGLLVGPYESRDSMQICKDWARSGIPKSWGMDLFEGDMERIMPHIEHSMYRVPCVANGNIRQVLNGPVSWASDGYPLLGPVLHKRNFWQCCAASYGIAHAGGIGKYLVDWIKDGEPPYELTELDPERYGEWATKHFVMEKVAETYGMNNHVVYPFEERPAARPIKMNPIYHRLKERGCQFGFHNGWETPNWFAISDKDAAAAKADKIDAPVSANAVGSPGLYAPSYRRTNWFNVVKREVDNVCNNVGIMDVSAFSKYMISGPKAREFLERMCANNMPKLGKTNISHMLTPKGKMYAELTISRLAEDKFYVVTGSHMERHDLRWLEQHFWQMQDAGEMDKHDVSFENLTGRMCVLAIAGPKSRQLLERLTFTDVSDEKFAFLDCRKMEVGSSPVLGIRISFTGELGWELHHDMEYTGPLYETLLKAGADANIIDFGGYAQNSLRLEKGFRLLGSDMTKDHSALEAGLTPRFVRLDKKVDFIGKAALLKEKELGGPKKLSVAMTLDTGDLQCDPVGNEPVYAKGSDKNIIGFTTTGGYGFNIQKSIGLGYVATEFAEPGNQVDIELGGRRITATVAKEPLVDTEPARTRKAKLRTTTAK